MSKSKTTQKSQQSVAPSTYSKPHIDAAATNLAPDYALARDNITKNVLPQIGRVNAFNERVMGGEFLRGNPHLQGVIDSTNRDIGTGVDSRFATAGRYGSGNHAGILARALAENETRLRYGDYAQERTYQDAAGGKILQGATISADLPQRAGSSYADAVARLLGQYNDQTGTNTTTQKQGALGPIMGVIGSGLTGWATGGFR